MSNQLNISGDLFSKYFTVGEIQLKTMELTTSKTD